MAVRRKKIKHVKTLKEFIEQWDKKLDKIIASHGMQDMAEDIKQDIYLCIATPDSKPDSPTLGQNGLERYDPKRSAFSTYVYGLVLVRVRNARAKRVRELGLMPYSHDTSKYDVDDEGRQTTRRDRNEAHSYDLDGKATDLERTEFNIQLRNVLETLRTYPVRSYFFKDGECITRDLATLLELIISGKTREEIVEYFQYSTGSVGVMFDQLRRCPELQELKDMIPGLNK